MQGDEVGRKLMPMDIRVIGPFVIDRVPKLNYILVSEAIWGEDIPVSVDRRCWQDHSFKGHSSDAV